jgi:hypothetical protein
VVTNSKKVFPAGSQTPIVRPAILLAQLFRIHCIISIIISAFINIIIVIRVVLVFGSVYDLLSAERKR